MRHATPAAKDHPGKRDLQPRGLGRFLGLSKGLGSFAGCVLRTACASISCS